MDRRKSNADGKRRKSSAKDIGVTPVNLTSGAASAQSINALSMQEENSATSVPEGILPLFLTTVTLKIFDIRIGENVTKEAPMSSIRKQDLLQDIQTRMAISDFQPAKHQIMVGFPTH